MKITVQDRTGVAHQLEATPGGRLMELIRDAGLPVRAECGGNCVCGTCHVYVDEPWRQHLTESELEEIAVLDEACAPQENSRLSCQITVTEALDGLKVTLAPDWA